MNKLSIITAILILLTNISADNKKHYIGTGGAFTQASTQTISKEMMADVTLKYGYALFNSLDLEARGSFYAFGGTKLYHPSSLGLFLKPNYDITSQTNIYTLLGYSHNTLSKQDTTNINAVTIQDDFSYGAGVEYNIFSDIFGYMDYVKYIDKSTTKPEGKYSIKINSLSLGINYKFGEEANNKEAEITEKSLVSTYITLPKTKVKARPQLLPIVYEQVEVEVETKIFPKFMVFDDMR